MCIIAAKPSGIDLPNKEILESCFSSNKDGIGFAYNKEGETPVISKGFFTVKSLMENLDEHGITKEHNLVVDFRFGTHGKKDAGNCHPFPLSPSFKDMRLLDCTCTCVVAHNGVFGNMPRSEQHSDTMKFIGGILASPEIINSLHTPHIKELLRGYCGMSSRLAFLRAEGITTIGDWETEEGIYYSNIQFKSYCRKPYVPPAEDTEYCYQHQKWDKCYKNHKKHDLQWCYHHKKYDHCTWCLEHQDRDTCEYDKKNNTKPIIIPKKVDKETILDLRQSCEWCRSIENVKYSYIEKSHLCEYCTKAMADYIPQSDYKGRGESYYYD